MEIGHIREKRTINCCENLNYRPQNTHSFGSTCEGIEKPVYALEPGNKIP